MFLFVQNASYANVVGSRVASAPAEKAGPLAGEVLETMDAASYTYLKLKTDSGEVWAAIPQTKIKKGAKITIQNPMTMTGFESKTLKRKFDKIVFGTLSEGPAPEGPMTGKSAGNSPATANVNPHSSMASPTAVDFKTVKVKKATGPEGKTVAEIYAQKKDLKDKEISVRGKVAKYLPGIMKKNWIHLVDGSGTAAEKNFDLTVTTDASAKAGDIVLVKGKVRTDRDLGAGYFFPVIIEEAKVSK